MGRAWTALPPVINPSVVQYLQLDSQHVFLQSRHLEQQIVLLALVSFKVETL
jgi:hypothetical protein